MELKDKIRKYRLENNLTQLELANLVFVSRSAVAKWENGLGMPGDSSIEMLCNVFKIEKEELLNDIENEESHIRKNNKIFKQRIVIFSLVSLFLALVIVFCCFIPKIIGNNKDNLFIECPKASLNDNEKYLQVDPPTSNNNYVAIKLVDDFLSSDKLDKIKGAKKNNEYIFNVDVEYEKLDIKYFYLDNEYNYLEKNEDKYEIQKINFYPGPVGYSVDLNNNKFSIASNDYYNLIRIDVFEKTTNIRFRYMFLFV